MQNENNYQKYYLGLDIGTDSVGYAVTNKSYDLIKFKCRPMWGSTLFDGAETSEARRSFRTGRRRLGRRQHRIELLQELFAKAVAEVDERFFYRIKSSALWREDSGERYSFFDDEEYNDVDYHNEYPTIHHLIDELMKSDNGHDVRLVYLACAWLVAHRGHFLSDVSRENVAQLRDFGRVYVSLREWFEEKDYPLPVGMEKEQLLEDALKQKLSVSRKYENLKKNVLGGKKPHKDECEIDAEIFYKMLCGSSVKLKDLFRKDEYEEVESFSLSSDDEVLAERFSKASGDDAQLLQIAKSVYDWSVLNDILQGKQTISEAKIEAYNQHKSDLKWLKDFVKKYSPKSYNAVFCDKDSKDSYSAYRHKASSAEGFFKSITKLLKGITPEECDAEGYNDALSRLETGGFLPKQVMSDNRVIPYQLYWYELDAILKNAEKYLPFLSDKDGDGVSVSDKVRSIFEFRVSYFVGPLNTNSDNGWVVRSSGKIYPWNIENMVDYDRSEEAFIKKLIGKCTYLPGESVLPKDSLLYHRYTVLNEINNLKIDGVAISVELKQKIYNEVFLKNKKVTIKKLRDYLTSHECMAKDAKLSGVDNGDEIHSDLKPWHDFRHLIFEGLITEADAEDIIVRITTSTDKPRLVKWLKANYPTLSDDDVKYVSGLKYKDFGRLSREFLCGIEGMCKEMETGEPTTIIRAMWETNNNLMELLSDKYTFVDIINERAREYYAENPRTVAERLDEMYVSNPVKRPIIRTLDIINDVRKAMDGYPEKIFVEMARGAAEDRKNKRTISRKQQILDLYDKCGEDTSTLRRQLEAMGDTANSRLQSKSLFLYYMQLGKCMYTGKAIELSELSSRYNIDHIYPQALVKDDSILNNMVLVDSESNGVKSDAYPIDASTRKEMYSFWTMLRDNNLITDEKYKRLTRSTGFSPDEKWGFINRQITETTQSTKAVATLLHEICPESEIVYVKARLTSEFRQEFDCLKSRTFNDLHHAKDAYLNIVTGNVYNSKFTRNWFMKNYDNKYSIRTDTLFTHKVEAGGELVWDGIPMLSKVKATVAKNNAHMTRYAFLRKSGQNGGFFDQNPLPKDKDGSKDLFPRKAGLDTKKYGGYRGLTITGFMLVKYAVGKKTDIMIMPVPLISVGELSKGQAEAEAYIKSRIDDIIGKTVESVSLPLGMRMLKINTMFSADGFRFCLAGSANKGERIIAYPMISFDVDAYWNRYVKALERISEKQKLMKEFVYDEAEDIVNQADNIRLYDLYIDKLKNTVYSKRPNNGLSIIESGKEDFEKLSVPEQADMLLAIHSIFGRNTRGCDLTKIGGSSQSAVTRLSSMLSNWKKVYKDVRIIDTSTSGLWEHRSDNLLELL